MSGFFGILRADGREVDQDLLQRLAVALEFRGSDGGNIWRRPGAGTCFAYLATGPAPQSTQQPVTLADNWLVGDIRLDARRELTDRLYPREEYPSSELTSEELLLRAWQTWSQSSLQNLLGDFSFALWDQAQRSLWCARDFIGPRPFYYARARGIFCFSNTLEALRAVPGISSALDETFIGEFLLRGSCADLSRTVYADIRRLPAGHLLQYTEHDVHVERFLTLPIEEPLRFSQPEELSEAYREVLRYAVQDRLPRVSTALYLSGGLDSGSVCAMACQLADQRSERQKLKAFTVSWKPLFEDQEPHFAALSARHLGLAHQILEAESFEPFAKLAASADRSPEPTCEAFFSLAQKHYRAIASYSRVILSGDGGDDVLTGQSWPYFVYLWVSGERLEIARTLGSFLWEHKTIPPLRAGIKARLQSLAGRSDQWKGYPNWLNPEFEKRCRLREKWLYAPPPPKQRHSIHPEAYAALHQGYWSTVLESEDAGTSRVALETRAPLLDLRVLRFLLRVPPVPWCVGKELARRSLQKYLPDAVLTRPKTPLAADPLEACIETRRWAPHAPHALLAGTEEFVELEKWKEALKYSKGCTSGPNLFPLALFEWLKDIENREGIK
jgi:asparagine synthase (glutamine-hydrolysing)